MSKERFEFWENDYAKGITDFKGNECYITTNSKNMKELTSLLNQQDHRIAELEEQLKNATPKFNYHQVVYVLCNTDIIKGQIDCFDYYNKKYLIWTMEFGLGNEWCYEHELFATKEEAQAKLKELGESNVKD